ncbi:ATP-binding protein [Ferrovibrio sp.]|uniref:ATP-binding protein n=1 Tax=Ferrovibrio sp. TaxID=1917215 RepID=UPI0025C6F72D|nr:ATP-binding protein [Ferrovibrio sp.]MBX3454621.1 PAS domain-containing protein [Ferrovibrio sp.]
MKIAWHRRLSVKQLKVTVLAALLLGLISSLFQVVLDIRAELRNRDATVAQVMDMLYEPAAQAAYALDEQLAARVVRGLLLYRPIQQAEIYDNYGRRMAFEERPIEQAETGWVPDWLRQAAKDMGNGKGDIRMRPLHATRGNELVGEIRVAVDDDLLAHSIWERIWVVFGTGLVRNFAFALLMMVLFYFTLTRPLVALVQQLGQVDPGKPGGRNMQPPPGHADDEFGLMVERANGILAASAGHLAQRDRERVLLRTVLDNLPARITLKDRSLRYLLLNRAAAKFFGLPEGEERGQSMQQAELPGIAEDEREAFRAESLRHDREVLQSRKPILGYEMRFRDPRGEECASLLGKVPMFDDEGRLYGLLTIATDITTRRRAEQALDAANAQLRVQAGDLERLADSLRREREHAIAANRAKSEFLANMSHELRTPLNAVIGFAELIVQRMWGNSSEKYFDYAQDIALSARHLLNVINDILDMSKIEAGRYELSLEETDPVELVEDCITIVKGRAREAGLHLNCDVVPDSLPHLLVDRRAVKQVLLNLLSNAIKFTPAGGHVDITARQEAGGEVVLSVRDTGIGIPPEHVEKIFEPFWQGDSSIRRSSEGTGLGLAISRKFMRQHGGDVEIRSEPGRGTVAIARFSAESRVVPAA